MNVDVFPACRRVELETARFPRWPRAIKPLEVHVETSPPGDFYKSFPRCAGSQLSERRDVTRTDEGRGGQS